MEHVKWTRSLHPAFVERDGAFCSQHIVFYSLFFLGPLAKPSQRSIKGCWPILCSSLMSAAQLLPKLMTVFTCCVIRFCRIWLLLFSSQGDSDIRRWRLRLLLLCLQLQGTWWSSARLWASGGRSWYFFVAFFWIFQLHLMSWFVSTFLLLFRSTQLEKRSLPMEEACHITMEVSQLQHLA